MTRRTYVSFVLRFCIFAILSTLSALYAHAHVNDGSTISYVKGKIEGNKIYFLNIDLENLPSHFFYAGYPDTREKLLESIRVENNGRVCSFDDFILHEEDSFSEALYYFTAYCSGTIQHLHIVDNFYLEGVDAKVYILDYNGLLTTFGGTNTVDFTAIATKTNGMILENKDEKEEKKNSPAPPKPRANYLRLFMLYLTLGLEHILSGIDHILFIIGFILLSSTLGGLLKGISGFTVSHSITLTLAALSILTLNAKIVEPLIGLSIAIVGILSMFHLAKKWLLRFSIIFLFGLFHGLGFAGSIAEVGFPKNGFVTALLAFNIGIELGQLIIVCAFYPVLEAIQKRNAALYTKIVTSISVLISIAGLFWFVQRLFF